MDEAYRLAKAVCMASMAPRGLDTPEKAMVAIMHGLELGLTPMAALQRIAVVNGRPTIWGDGAVALVRASGLCEYINETMSGAGDARIAICKAKRKGEADPIARTFSVADAKKAGLWGKQGPWTQYPDRMLAMRARAFCLRDGFADVLGGLYLREELDDGSNGKAIARDAAAPAPPPVEHQPVTFTSGKQPSASEPSPLPPVPAEIVSPDTGEIRSAEDITSQIIGEIGDALNEQVLDHVLGAYEPEIAELPRELSARVETAYGAKRDALRKANILAAG